MKNRFHVGLFRTILSAACLSMFSGCAMISQNKLYQGPFERPDWLEDGFDNSLDWIPSTEEKNGFQQITLSSRVDGQGFQSTVVMDYYRCDEPGKRPAILVSPILGGKNRVSSHFARYLSKRGFHCMVVHRPKDLTNDLNDLQQLDDRLRHAVIRDRAALDWLCGRDEVDVSAIGAFGVSYGGIKNVILAGVDSRLKANVFALAGADMAKLVTHSNHKVLKRLRTFLEENGANSNKEMEEAIRETIRAEPLRFAPYVDPDSTLLILARADRTVPRENGEILRRALGYPKTLYIPCAHYSAALFTGMFGLPYIEQITLEFFERQFIIHSVDAQR